MLGKRLTVRNEVRCGEVLRVCHGVPDSVVLAVVPKSAVLVVLDEEQLVGSVSAELIDLAIMGDEGLELATQSMSLNPIHPSSSSQQTPS